MTNTNASTLAEAIASSRCDPELAAVIETIAAATARLSALLAEPCLATAANEDRTINAAGDVQHSLDREAHGLFVDALGSVPVRAMLSEETDDVIEMHPGASYAVAIDPLDGSSNIAINAPLGTIFSVLRAASCHIEPDGSWQFAGDAIVAAGFVLYGPATVLMLSTGEGLDSYRLDRERGLFELSTIGVELPSGTREFAINSSNYRHWDAATRQLVDDMIAGADGPRGVDYNMRWIAALVAETYRILVRGGIFLYPADQRPGYGQGRLRLVYEAQPIAFLVEQAGGAASDGTVRILDKTATTLHERTALIFGSAEKIARLAEYQGIDRFTGEHSPLFARRGLLRG